MAINFTDGEVGQPLQENVDYIWRIIGVSAYESQASGNLLMGVSAAVVEGPSEGTSAQFPAYEFMIHDASVGHPKTAVWMHKTRTQMAKIMGVSLAEVVDLPTEAGEQSESMKNLINTMFEAPAQFQEETADWPEKWLIGRVVRHVDPSEVAPADWGAFFRAGMDEAATAEAERPF